MSQDISRRFVLGAMGAAPVVAGALAAGEASAQTAGAVVQTSERGVGAGVAVANAGPRPRSIGTPSRHFQFTPSIDEASELCKRSGFDCMEWNIRFGGHVPPEQVETALPKAVEAARKVGLKCEMVCTSIVDSKTPHAETILRAMRDQGIRFYRSSNYFQWNFDQPLRPQLEALKARMQSIAELNAKYNTVTCYHTHPTLGDIGGNVWDFMYVMKDLDPNLVGFNFDTNHTSNRGANGWRPAAIAAKKHIAALSVKTSVWRRGGSGGNPNSPVWSVESVPLEAGQIDLRERFVFLRDTGFSGPINIHFEHFGLYGTAIGDMSLDLTKEQVVRLMARDVQYLRTIMGEARFA